MISALPWKLDKEDPAIIYDTEGNIIARDYKFIHVDDFEAICSLINSGLTWCLIDPDDWVYITGSAEIDDK